MGKYCTRMLRGRPDRPECGEMKNSHPADAGGASAGWHFYGSGSEKGRKQVRSVQPVAEFAVQRGGGGLQTDGHATQTHTRTAAEATLIAFPWATIATILGSSAKT